MNYKAVYKGYGNNKNEKNMASLNDRKVLPICYLCNKVPPGGLRSGFFLKGIFICNECEKELINCNPNKKEEYMLTMAKLKNILFKGKTPIS